MTTEEKLNGIIKRLDKIEGILIEHDGAMFRNFVKVDKDVKTHINVAKEELLTEIKKMKND